MAEQTAGPPADRGQFKSRWGFILAASGSAVGLGNIWKFPYITGENGGGLFVLIYLVCIAVVGVPIMMAEIMIGRAARKQPVEAFHTLQGTKTGWASVGWLGILAGFVILSYYCVVAGWAMDYTLKSVVNFTADIQKASTLDAKKYRTETSVDDMREYLVALKTKEAVVEKKKEAVRPLKRREVQAYKLFKAAGGKDEQKRAILLEDPGLRANLEKAEPIYEEIDNFETDTKSRLEREYKQESDKEVRDEAEQEKRREVIFNRVSDTFGGVATDGWLSAFWAGLFMLIVILIVCGGISKGIERTCQILMPVLIVLIIVMVVYGMFQPGFGKALNFVFWPNPANLEPSGALEALGHAFFTLSLGMGAMITYGSYQEGKRGLASQSILIAVFDTGIALLACLMIFPIIFSYGQEPNQSAGLVFKSMPLAFAEIGTGGMMLAILFFGLLFFAALTSGISLLEVICSYFIDARGWPRRRAAALMGTAVFLFALPTAFSEDKGFLLSSWKPGYGKNFFDTMDYLASNWMLPAGGLLISLYAGWVMPKRLRNAELEGLSPRFVTGWLVLVRYVAPILVILVMLERVGVLEQYL